ncbi:MAG TPA: response regulator [Polyangiaceae bacterium]
MSKSNPPSQMRLANPVLRVLLIDDEPAVVRALRRTIRLRRPTWLVTVVSSPAEALAEIAREPVDVVVSDYEMPEISGLDLFRRIRRRHPTVLRIILSGKSRDSVSSVPNGLVHAWFPKTQSSTDLIQTIEDLLLRRETRRRSPSVG